MSFSFPSQSYFDKMFVFLLRGISSNAMKKFFLYFFFLSFMRTWLTLFLSVCVSFRRPYFCFVLFGRDQIGSTSREKKKKKLEEGLLLYICRTLCLDVGNVAPVRCSSSLSTLGPFLLLLPGDESLV